MIKDAIAKLIKAQDLSIEEADAAMSVIMAGEATEAQIGGFLIALRIKGETVDEIAGCARAMRRFGTPVKPKSSGLVDTAGTGGDGLGTFNISTTAAFIVAGHGLPVAKHGNRSVSSQCGSADLLQALGVNLALNAEQVAACVDEIGIGFMFAPNFHPAMKYAIGPRRQLGVRTIFNIMGPLCNPAGAKIQLLGVYAPELTEPMARALEAMGGEAALVVHGSGGVDELTTTGVNRVTHFAQGRFRTFEFDPQELGLVRAHPSDLTGGNAEQSGTLTRRILTGHERGPRRDVVLLNAAGAISATHADFKLGLQQAQAALDSGAALDKLDRLIQFSQKIAA